MGNKIIIIDDEPDMLKISRMMLEKLGYSVATAIDAEKALAMIAQDPPDLILLDLLLPEMRGHECCRVLKADQRFKNIPIILYTADLQYIQIKFKEIGADDYIIKPFDPNDLLVKIKKFIGPGQICS